MFFDALKKTIISIANKDITAVLVAGLLIACTESVENYPAPESTALYETLILRYEGAAGEVNFPELAEDLGFLAPVKLEYLGNNVSGPQSIQEVVTGDIDFGSAFNGAVVKLIATKVPIKAVVSSYGSDAQTFTGYFVKDGSPIKTARDLIGKKIAVNAFGAHHEFMIREYLYRNGLSKEEVSQVELVVLPPINTEQALRNGQVDAAALYRVFRDQAVARGGLHQLFTDIDLYGHFNAGSYVLQKQFIEKNPKTTQHFVEAVARAIEWTRTTPREEVITRLRTIIAKRQRNENDEAVKHWKSSGVSTPGGLIEAKDYQQWIDWLVRDGQLQSGQIDALAIFDNGFNPYQQKTATP